MPLFRWRCKQAVKVMRVSPLANYRRLAESLLLVLDVGDRNSRCLLKQVVFLGQAGGS
jgi:hypothetical protein